MKKFLFALLSLSIMLSYCVVSFKRIKIFADDSPATVEQTNEFTVSKPMTYSEMAQHFANENGIDYATVLEPGGMGHFAPEENGQFQPKEKGQFAKPIHFKCLIL